MIQLSSNWAATSKNPTTAVPIHASSGFLQLGKCGLGITKRLQQVAEQYGLSPAALHGLVLEQGPSIHPRYQVGT